MPNALTTTPENAMVTAAHDIPQIRDTLCSCEAYGMKPMKKKKEKKIGSMNMRGLEQSVRYWGSVKWGLLGDAYMQAR
jgi:hypothetical protein